MQRTSGIDFSGINILLCLLLLAQEQMIFKMSTFTREQVLVKGLDGLPIVNNHYLISRHRETISADSDEILLLSNICLDTNQGNGKV